MSRDVLKRTDYSTAGRARERADDEMLPQAGARELAGFAYKGVDSLGRDISGYVDDTDEATARVRLARAKIDVSAFAPRYHSVSRKRKKVTRTDLALFADQLADRLQAGEAMVLALRRSASATNHPTLREALFDVIEVIGQGKTTADAMRTRDDVFPATFVRVVQIGERKGDPTRLLVDYADGELRNAETWQKLRGMLAYPVTVLSIALVIGAGLVYYVLPKMEELYNALLSASGGELPLPTRLMLGTSRFLTTVPGIACMAGLCIAIVLAIRWARGPGKETIERKSLAWPVVGPLLRDINAAYVARTIGLLWDVTDSNTALKETSAATTNICYREMIEHITLVIPQEGTQFWEAFYPYPFYMGDEFVPVVTAGEASGTVDKQLTRYATLLEKRVQQRIESLMRRVEPVTMALLGIIIGAIVICSYLPLFSLIGELAGRGR